MNYKSFYLIFYVCVLYVDEIYVDENVQIYEINISSLKNRQEIITKARIGTKISNLLIHH